MCAVNSARHPAPVDRVSLAFYPEKALDGLIAAVAAPTGAASGNPSWC